MPQLRFCQVAHAKIIMVALFGDLGLARSAEALARVTVDGKVFWAARTMGLGLFAVDQIKSAHDHFRSSLLQRLGALRGA
ncbi:MULTISPECIES: hypothetical protein [Thiorhodovibrio]|uniref:hypothetical protein n=1 Tax=Thiorhodovibrio TaxID=61593 RepID=UPI00191463EA|nr:MULTISPECIES: hypothetical protein [Thiorhodovibrio]MBK5970405.1 hypothetical protein [Thiorhodovibrio winogradskyi]